MAYSTNSDVTDEFKSIDVVNGKITTTKIDVWIGQADEYIDGRIGLLYETPVGASALKSLKILKEISVGFVAQRIAQIMEMKSITPKGDQFIPKDLIKKAERRLEMIVNRTLLLSDATALSTDQGVKSYSSSNEVTRTFDQSKDQW